MVGRSIAFNVFKGIIVTLMIIINSPGIWGGHYQWLNYSPTKGCTLADMLMPAFLFAMGGSMWFSFRKYDYHLSKHASNHIFIRTAILLVVGALLTAFPFHPPALHSLSIGFTPLQIVALAYPISALLCLNLPKRFMILTIMALLLAHWVALDYGIKQGSNFNPNYLNKMVEHQPAWNQPRFPFNLFTSYVSILSACIPVLFGWLSGFVLTYRKDNLDLAVRDLAAYGLLLLVIGGLWSEGLPFYPHLFSGSYLLFCSGASLLLLSLLVWIYEFIGFSFGTGIFTIFGINPLLALIAAMIFSKSLMTTTIEKTDTSKISSWEWIYTQYFMPIEAFQFGNLLMSLVFTVLIWLICRIAYQYKYFVKV